MGYHPPVSSPVSRSVSRPLPVIDALDVVRWTLAAFDANADAGDAEIAEILRKAGLPRANHAVAMVPLAFGRRVLHGVIDAPATYVEVDGRGAKLREAALADDPIFVVADQLARTESSASDVPVALRSPELRAVHQAMKQGKRPRDLVLPPPRLCLDGKSPVAPRAPDAQALVDELVRARGAELAIATRVSPFLLTPAQAQLELDLGVRVGERWCFEAFSGVGATIHAAVTDGVDKLARGPRPVMLAVLAGRALGGDQVTWEIWGDFEVCHGPLLHQGGGDGPQQIDDYLGALRDALLAAPPTADEIHWLHTFAARDGDELAGREVRLDNKSWPPGVAIAAAWPWPRSASYYTLRHFCMLVPRRDN